MVQGSYQVQLKRQCMPCGGAVLSYTYQTQLCSASSSTVLVLPILTYACGMWAADRKASSAAEKLHRQLLKQLLHVRKSTASEVVLADFGRYLLQVCSDNTSFHVTTTEC